MSIFNAIKNALLRCEAGYRVIAGIDSSGNPQLFGCSTPTAATGTLTSDNTAPSDGDTVTIGTQVYTARTALTATTTANEVLINSTADAFLLNLIRAINKSGTPGTDYGSLTVKNSDVTAATSVTAHAFVVTAIVAGGVGNNVATTETSARLSWGQTTLTGGVNSGFTQNLTQVGGASIALGPAAAAASLPVTETGAANGPVSRVTSTGVAQTLFIARPTRVGVLVRNTDTANSVWIGPATVTSSNGFLLKAGESLPIPFTGLYQIIDDGSNHAVIHVMDNYN